MTERTLVILRHAKAEQPSGQTDSERPLTERGQADAAAAGAWLAARGLVPDQVVCSPARRTRQTWHAVAQRLPTAPTVSYQAAVYDSDARDLLALLRQLPEEAATVLLVGHNPTVSQLSELLDRGRSGNPAGLRTSGLAVHAVGGSWTDLRPGGAPRREQHTARAT